MEVNLLIRVGRGSRIVSTLIDALVGGIIAEHALTRPARSRSRQAVLVIVSVRNRKRAGAIGAQVVISIPYYQNQRSHPLVRFALR